jgi:hypothetical protein
MVETVGKEVEEMSFQFRPAVRESVGLLIGLAGQSGAGKTMSALRLAKGIAGGKPFAFIDTESRRGLHYADMFDFHHGDMQEPFSPDAYTEAIVAADKAGYPVIVVDSMSHSWAGTGGVLDMQEAEFQRMGGRESVKMASWIKPKMAHKKMVARLLQIRAHVILCFRAEPKVEMVKDAQGKMQVVAKQTLTSIDGFIPICDKSLPFELTASFLLTADKPGVGHPVKLQAQHRPLFPTGELIDEKAGERIAEWAAGGTPRPAAPVPAAPASEPRAGNDPIAAQLEQAAAGGKDALLTAWRGLTNEQRDEHGATFGRLKRSAK